MRKKARMRRKELSKKFPVEKRRSLLSNSRIKQILACATSDGLLIPKQIYERLPRTILKNRAQLRRDLEALEEVDCVRRLRRGFYRSLLQEEQNRISEIALLEKYSPEHITAVENVTLYGLPRGYPRKEIKKMARYLHKVMSGYRGIHRLYREALSREWKKFLKAERERCKNERLRKILNTTQAREEWIKKICSPNFTLSIDVEALLSSLYKKRGRKRKALLPEVEEERFVQQYEKIALQLESIIGKFIERYYPLQIALVCKSWHKL